MMVGQEALFSVLAIIIAATGQVGSEETEHRLVPSITPGLELNLSECQPNLMQPTLALAYRESSPGVQDPDSTCDGDDVFKTMCYAESICFFKYDEFVRHLTTRCPQWRDFTDMQLRYRCFPESSVSPIDDTIEAMRVGKLASPGFPQYTTTQPTPVPAATSGIHRCSLFRQNTELFKLTSLDGWITFEDEFENRDQFSVIGIAADNNPDTTMGLNTTDNRQFMDYSTLENQQLTRVNISHDESSNDLKFILEFEATHKLVVCCSEVNSTDYWPTCEGQYLGQTEDVDSAGSPPMIVWLIPLICVLVLLLVPCIVVVLYRWRKKRSKYQHTPTSGDSPRPDAEDVHPNNANNNYDREQPEKGDNQYSLAMGDRGSYTVDDGTYAPIRDVEPPKSRSTQSPVAQPIKIAPPRKQPVAGSPTDSTEMAVYAEPLPKTKRPGYAPPTNPTQNFQRQISDSAPRKPARLHQGIVEDSKRRLSEKLDLQHTGPGPTPGERESTIVWDSPNPIYEQS